MWPVTGAYLEAIQSPHEIVIRADVDKGGVRLYSDLPVVGGSVSVDSNRITRRECDLLVAPRLRDGVYGDRPSLPESPGAPLGHYGQEITLRHGLVYPNGVTEWVPIGVYRIDAVDGSLLDQSGVQITGRSREAWIADHRFPFPRTVSGPSAQQLIADLIHETDPAFVVVPSATQDRRIRRTTFDEDRWDAITQIARSIGAVVYADAAGRFVIRDAPTLDSPPVWKVASGGVLISADQSSSRDRVYNRVVCRGENPASGARPVSGQARDTDPTSPTRYGSPSEGAYGRVIKFMSIPTITTSLQARSAAAAELARSTGAASSVDIGAVPNIALEALDVIDLWTDPSDVNTIRRHVVDSFSFDLAAGGDFGMGTRDIRQVGA
ncbi:DUF5047 domain-containing protein [Ruania suaedae]|uniref:DUF5047 domain-containing protein n=1 Tax=Ruania suaedae TaxID=2897774 RepID=UPI001E2AF65B|nr:DUF5047 domain-containing protein [Ruania suaedae]UFU03430.1 DUF5047 domain-containing protein [Ruania suaedae]